MNFVFLHKNKENSNIFDPLEILIIPGRFFDANLAGFQVNREVVKTFGQSGKHGFVRVNAFFPPPISEGEDLGFFVEGKINPGNETISINHGEHVVAILPLSCGFVNLPGVFKIEYLLDQFSVPDQII